MEELFIEFYRNKDEEAFLHAWEAKHGVLSEKETDNLYIKIADTIDRQVKEGKHELGDLFEYKEVPVGRSDYNSFYNLYLFEQE